MRILAVLVVVAAVVVVSCSETTSSGQNRTAAAPTTERTSGGGGSLWNQVDNERKARLEAKAAGKDPSEYERKMSAGAAQLPAGWKGKMDGWWEVFRMDDPGWPDARRAWLALGAPAPEILSENVLRASMFEWDAARTRSFQRCKAEIVILKEWSTPLIVQGLAMHLGDSTIRNVCADLLGAMGDYAVPALTQALGEAVPNGRWDVVRALRQTRAAAAVPALATAAEQGDDFRPRIEALAALGEIADARGYDAVAKCLADRDWSVVKFAARSVKEFKRPEAVPVLVRTLARAGNAHESDTMAAVQESLVSLTGRSFPADPGAWDAFINSPAWTGPRQ